MNWWIIQTSRLMYGQEYMATSSPKHVPNVYCYPKLLTCSSWCASFSNCLRMHIKLCLKPRARFRLRWTKSSNQLSKWIMMDQQIIGVFHPVKKKYHIVNHTSTKLYSSANMVSLLELYRFFRIVLLNSFKSRYIVNTTCFWVFLVQIYVKHLQPLTLAVNQKVVKFSSKKNPRIPHILKARHSTTIHPVVGVSPCKNGFLSSLPLFLRFGHWGSRVPKADRIGSPWIH